jgi:hypothetical protein
VFPADRLRAQQQHIARRVELLVHPARVITFPSHQPGPRAVAARSRVAPRWVAAAAAAGLFLGIGLGTFFDPDAPGLTPASAGVVGPPAAPAGPVSEQPLVLTSAPESLADAQQFLSELELALERPHAPELFALDAMTPHVREVRVQFR